MFKEKRLHFFYLIFCFRVMMPVAHSQNIDINLLKSINPQPPSSGFWKATSKSYILVSGTASLGSLAYAFLQNEQDLKHKSCEVLIGIGINVIATTGMKLIVNRSRPYESYPNDVAVISMSSGSSFPSGHTSLAFATATSFTLAYRKWYIAVPAYLWAGCMGYSRMYLGKHYPSDVLGGAAVGVGSSLLSHWLSKKLFVTKSVVHKELTVSSF